MCILYNVSKMFNSIFNLVLQYEQKQAINYLHRNSCMYLGLLKNSHASIQITIRIQSKYVFACCRYFSACCR